MDSSPQVNVFKKWCSISGAGILISTACFIWYWGNMSIYAFSYFVSQGQSGSLTTITLTSSVYLVINNFAFIVSGYMAHRMGKRTVIVIGVLLNGCGLMTTYFSITGSLTTFNITNGAIVGFGQGMINSMGLQYAGEWGGKDVGVIMGAVQNFASIGGVVVNQFITKYVNPRKETPDLEMGKYDLFSQLEVTENVPSMFLILGSSFSAIGVAGLLMVRDSVTEEKKRGRKMYDATSVTDNENGNVKEGDVKRTPNPNMPVPVVGTDHTPKQMLKTKSFYVIVYLCTFSENAMMVFHNWYKIFGQQWIKNDYFLTHMSTVICVSAILGRVTLGRVTDRLGAKTCLIVIFTILPISCMFFYFSPMVNKCVFLVAVFMFAFCGGIYSTYGSVMVKLFGTTHFPTNFGIMTCTSVIVQLAMPVVIKEIIVHWGWFALFFVSGAPCVLGVILIIVFLPDT